MIIFIILIILKLFLFEHLNILPWYSDIRIYNINHIKIISI